MACITNIIFNSVEKDKRKEFFIQMVHTINHNLKANDEKFGDINAGNNTD